MPTIDLKYGRSNIAFEYDEARFAVLGARAESPALSDAEIGEKLDRPTDSSMLEDIVGPGDSVLIAVPDATRQTGCGQIVNLVVRRLIANGTAPHDIRIIFSTGIHRKVTEAEKAEILTPFIAQRIKTLDHDPRDLMQIIQLGETADGIKVELNRAIVEHDHVVLIGGVSFHYFAGFTGGRKLICPGLASSKTVAETHRLAFDCSIMSRRDNVGRGILNGNAVHEAFEAVVEKAPPRFAITSVVNRAGEVTDLFCGNWRSSHREACESYSDANTIAIKEKRDLVIVSCGGYPHDLNLIQAHKALDAAAQACVDGGTIFLLAECSDGLGRSDLINWFDAANSRELAERLCEKYQVNGQTAWSLLTKTERFDVRMVTALDPEPLEKMGIRPLWSLDAELRRAAGRTGYIIPDGGKVLLR